MQGFVNFAASVAYALEWIIPTICYLVGSGLFILAGYGAWQCWRSGSWWSSRKFLIVTESIVGSLLLTFPSFLNEANRTFGSNVTATISAGATAYVPPVVNTSALIGATPEQTLLNFITLFQGFFISYGAFIVLVSVFLFRGVTRGETRHGYSLPLISFAFGIALMNLQTIAQWVISNFNVT